jgi:hypothetical protein
MNVYPYNTTDYENKHNWTLGQNKPNSKPIQSQSNPILPTPKGVKQKSDAGCQRSDICLLASVHGPHDRNQLRLQWHFRAQKTSQKQDFVFQVWYQICLSL